MQEDDWVIVAGRTHDDGDDFDSGAECVADKLLTAGIFDPIRWTWRHRRVVVTAWNVARHAKFLVKLKTAPLSFSLFVVAVAVLVAAFWFATVSPRRKKHVRDRARLDHLRGIKQKDLSDVG
jgi:hypothetical protein